MICSLKPNKQPTNNRHLIVHRRPLAFAITKKNRINNKCHINSTKNCLCYLTAAKKAESEVKRTYQQIDVAVDNGDRRTRVQRLVTIRTDAMTKTIKRHDQLLAH